MEGKRRLYVISGPSGAGKSTIATEVVNSVTNINLSVSITTRKPRTKEKEGNNYFFISVKEFKEKIRRGEFIEWAKVHGNYYGTLSSHIGRSFQENKDILLEIDIQGAKQIKDKYPESILIFILPPDLEELEKRLSNRKTETKNELEKRISNGLKEIGEIPSFDHVIINDKLKDAVHDIIKIIKNKRSS